MKSIDERADALACEIAKSFYVFYNRDNCGSRTAMLYFENNWRHLPGLHALVCRASTLVGPILTELAADLNAEKEKEVAELKTAIQELSNSKVAGDQLNAKYIKQIAEQSTLPPRINAQAFWCDNRHVVDYETAFEIEKELLAELTATRSLLDEVKSALEYANQLAKQISGGGSHE